MKVLKRGFSNKNPNLLGFFVISIGSLGLGVVEIEEVIVVEVTLDRVEVDQHVLELFQQEKTRCHALSAVDRVCIVKSKGGFPLKRKFSRKK